MTVRIERCHRPVPPSPGPEFRRSVFRVDTIQGLDDLEISLADAPFDRLPLAVQQLQFTEPQQIADSPRPQTVRKMLQYSVPPGYQWRQPARRPKLEAARSLGWREMAWVGIIDHIL